jgi:hypothetical protein
MFVFAGCFKGVCGEGNAGAKLIALGWFVSFSVIFSFAWSEGSEDLAHTYAVYAIYSVLSFIEYKILEVCVVIWVVQLASDLMELRINPAAQSIGPTGFFYLEALTNLCLILAGITLVIQRFLFQEHLRHMVVKDREKLASIFQGIRSDASLSRLADACDEIAGGLNTDSAALRQPTRNLTQLRAQAAALQILMDSKLSAWSSFYPGLGEPECNEKGIDINTVKLFACLDGDTAKLFDYCVGNIMFDDIGRLLLCLNFIHGDASVRILRLKNSFRRWNEEGDTLGYRYVS